MTGVISGCAQSISVDDPAHYVATVIFDTLCSLTLQIKAMSSGCISRCYMEGKTKANFWLDIVLAAGLGMTLIPSMGGIRIHEAVGIALGLGVIAHLSLHWKWMVAMSKSFFKKLPGAVRFKLMLNILSLFAFSLTLVSGWVISPTFFGKAASAGAVIQRSDLVFGRDRLFQRQAGSSLTRPMLRHGDSGFHWYVIHHASALLTLLTVTLHLALHWRWIASATKRFMPKSLSAREIGS